MISRRRKSAFGRKSMPLLSRTPHGLKRKKLVLILTESRETEPNYFDALKNEDRVKAGFKVNIKRTGDCPDKVVRRAIELQEEEELRDSEGIFTYDQIWCVLDMEGPENLKSMNEAIGLAQKNNIRLCLSNPCFEIWLLSHFVREGRYYRNAKAVEQRLNKSWPDHTGQKYDKSAPRIYNMISGLTDQAIQNAQWVREEHHKNKKSPFDCNSSTEVYRLVKFLLGRD